LLVFEKFHDHGKEEVKACCCFSDVLVLVHVVNMHALVVWVEWKNARITTNCLHNLDVKDCIVCCHERHIGFTYQFLLGSYTKKIFKEKIGVSLRFLCEQLDPFLKKQDIHLKIPIFAKTRVIILLCKIGMGDGLHDVREVFVVAKSTMLVIMENFAYL
jgi:hypothetical protein